MCSSTTRCAAFTKALLTPYSHTSRFVDACRLFDLLAIVSLPPGFFLHFADAMLFVACAFTIVAHARLVGSVSTIAVIHHRRFICRLLHIALVALSACLVDLFYILPRYHLFVYAAPVYQRPGRFYRLLRHHDMFYERRARCPALPDAPAMAASDERMPYAYASASAAEAEPPQRQMMRRFALPMAA